MGRELYGIAEIAESLGMTRQTVTVWRKRRSYAMPEPDAELSSGPVWRSATIEPWIQVHRSRLAGQSTSSNAPLQRGDVKRAGRRLFRLVALLLEEPLRPQLVRQALSEVEELGQQVAHAAEDSTRDRLTRVLQPVIALASDDVSDGGHLTELTRRLLGSFAELANTLADVLHDEEEPRR